MNDATAPRTILVTGAGAGTGIGIGRATARAFAAQGAVVVAVGRRPEPLAETADGHPGVMPMTADITGDGEPERIVRATLAEHGRLDVLVNNAGVAGSSPLADVTAQAVDTLLATNVVAPVLLARAALPALAEGGGVIVNVSTPIGLRGWPENSVYGATKAALDSLTRSWAVELAPRGVRVVAVAPGAIDTSIGDHMGLSPEQKAAVRAWQIAHTPLGRIGRPEEAAWAITRLADPSAAFVTGVVLPVDGGAAVS
ncbi:SDR family oxidoreductase [Streptomyces sp. 8K308]|uniref:SDR family NAD(P)-dependent oxidoreductase n=1 Tax=Streptomyces sp. 8K308 TaxID=2530388 RepID=UPI0010462A60|nr:SDR family oxidoreductase [Streptomyces sp. 8K308]TDC25551.1 SDR family oxidoreductase [Streptomyces sp. 8K308]